MTQGSQRSWLLQPTVLAALAAGTFILFQGGTFHGAMKFWGTSLATHLLVVWGCIWVARRLPGRRETTPEDPAWRSWLLPFAGGPFLHRRDRSMLWVATALALYMTARGLGTPMPRFGLPAAVGALAGMALVLGTVMALHRSADARARALEIFSVVGGLVAAGALGRWMIGDTPRAMLPFGHHNLLGAFVCLTIPVQLAVALSPFSSTRGRQLSILAAIFSGLALVGTRSLGAVGGLMAVVPLLLLLWGRRGPAERRPVAARSLRLLAMIVAAGGLLTILSPPGQELARRFSRIAIGQGDASGAERMVFIGGALDGLEDAGWTFGVGTGMTPFSYPLDLRQRGVKQPEGIAVTHLHSSPFQVLYELGIVGFTLAAALALLALGGLVRRARYAESGSDQMVLMAVVGAGFTYLIRCGTDVNLLAPAIPWSAAFLLGLGLSVPAGPEEETTEPRLGLASVTGWSLALPAILVLPLWLRADLAQKKSDQAVVLVTQAAHGSARLTPQAQFNLFGQSYRLFEAAHKLDPNFGFYAFELGLVCEALNEIRPHPQWQAQAEHWLSRAVRTTPTVPGYALHLGALQQKNGDDDKALAALSLAAALEHRSIFALPLLARTRLNLGDPQGLHDALVEGIRQRPAAACAEMLHQPPIDAFLDAIIDEVVSLDPESGQKARLLAASCGGREKILDRMTYNRVDDQDPFGSRSLYIFRRKALTTLTAPLEFRITNSTRVWQGIPYEEKTEIRLSFANRMGASTARALLKSQLSEGLALLPPGFR